jgi:SAM-dependent methyltransferase
LWSIPDSGRHASARVPPRQADTAWLDTNGFDAVGYDASPGLIAEAKRRHPHCQFLRATLPERSGVDAGTFANVLCETVMMRLPADIIGAAVVELRGLLAPGGTLYLSWRVTEGADRRDETGRLYTSFDASVVRDGLAGTVRLFDEEGLSASSGKVIHRTIVRIAVTEVGER